MDGQFALSLLSRRPESACSAAQLELDLTKECTQMEEELGMWLHQRWDEMAPRVQHGELDVETEHGMPVSLGRVLVAIWCTSPGARSRFSEDTRNGLLAALEAMDDPEASLIIGDLLESGRKETPHRPMAA